MRIGLVLAAVAAVLLTSGCGSKKSNGFGAATQPPPAATTGVSTSQATPAHVRYVYPRPLARRVMQSCLSGSGGTAELCGCALKRLENTVKPSALAGSGLAARIRTARRGCKG